MATELGKAYVQIIPSAKGISGSISSALGGEATKAGEKAGFNIAGAIKSAIAAAGIGTAIKTALDQGGELEQNLGGTEAVFGQFAETIQKDAKDAYKNMGLSASDYMATANKMGSLFQGSGVEQQRALELTSNAMQRAADVASVMGLDTSMAMESIAGAAKGNFTMMDNLGVAMNATTLEAYALEEGVNFKWNTASNAEKAELAMKMFMDRTSQYEGNFARESEETFSGSLGAMKAAAQDMMANLALGNDIGPSLSALMETVRTFVFNNLIPMLGHIVEALPDVFSGAVRMIIQSLNIAANNAEDLAKIAIDLITTLVSRLIGFAPYMAEAAISLIAALGNALIETDWSQVISDLVGDIRDNLAVAGDDILGNDGSIIDGILESITKNLPLVLDKGIEIITNVANGILEAIPSLVSTAGELITKFVQFVANNFPTILKSGSELLLKLIDGIVNNLPQIVTAIVKVIGEIVATIGRNLPEILRQGILILAELAAGLIRAIPQLISNIPTIIHSIADAFQNTDWASIGYDILYGIADGLWNGLGIIADAAIGAAQEAFYSACSWLGINSPAKKGIWIGAMYDEGLAEGIDENMRSVQKAADSMLNDSFGNITVPSSNFDFSNVPSGSVTVNMTINGAEGQDVNALAEIIQERINNAVSQRELVYA